MKRTKRRLLGIIAVVLVCTMLMGMTAHAELFENNKDFRTIYDISGTVAAPITSPRSRYTFYIGYALDYTLYSMPYSVTSKKKNVILVNSYESSEKITIRGQEVDVPIRGITVIPNKVGKATYTVDFSDSSGTKRSAKQTIRCYKWSNPFKTLKIGKKSFKKLFKKTNSIEIAPVSGKLNIKMNGPYKKLKVYYAAKDGAFVKISNKGNVTLNSGDRLLFRYKDNKNHVIDEEAVFTVR